MHVGVFSHVPLFATPWTVACLAPLSMGYPRQEYWSGLPFPSPGALSNPGTDLLLLHWQADSLPLSHLGNPSWEVDKAVQDLTASESLSIENSPPKLLSQIDNFPSYQLPAISCQTWFVRFFLFSMITLTFILFYVFTSVRIEEREILHP